MAIEVKVLYATPTADPLVWAQPFSVQTRGTFLEVQAMPSADVLAVSIFRLGPPGPPRKLIGRMYPEFQKLYKVDDEEVLYGSDFLAIGHYVNPPKNWIFWDQWNENEDTFYALDLDDETAGRQTFARPQGRLPAGADVMVFTGAYVHPPDWAVALGIIDSTLRV